jgi:hypothetical protein
MKYTERVLFALGPTNITLVNYPAPPNLVVLIPWIFSSTTAPKWKTSNYLLTFKTLTSSLLSTKLPSNSPNPTPTLASPSCVSGPPPISIPSWSVRITTTQRPSETFLVVASSGCSSQRICPARNGVSIIRFD